MRLRILLTDGKKTIDLIWLKHTGSDVYCGYVKTDNKYSYHRSGKRHQKWKNGKVLNYKDHLPLTAFKDYFEICSFGFGTKELKSKIGQEYAPLAKSDATLYLDSRTLPNYINISVGLLEQDKPLPYPSKKEQEIINIIQIMIITTITPWIYIKVHCVKEKALQFAREKMEEISKSNPCFPGNK